MDQKFVPSSGDDDDFNTMDHLFDDRLDGLQGNQFIFCTQIDLGWTLDGFCIGPHFDHHNQKVEIIQRVPDDSFITVLKGLL